MNSNGVDVRHWFESLKDQNLLENEKSLARWTKYKNDLEVTRSLLAQIPQKVSHKVMVPIGPKALMRGKIVHTNEFLVNLGETWFVKRSGFQTDEMCVRRMKACDEMIQKLEKERELIEKKSTLPTEEDAFGNVDRPEIIEYVTEEENEEWKKQHRIKEREYRQKLAELRNRDKKQIDTEEDLWKHLDELELQEELEDELNRLHAKGYSSDESESESDISNKSPSPINEINTSVTEAKAGVCEPDCESKPESNNTQKKRKVSFACDFETSDDEPLILKITHTNVTHDNTSFDSSIINSPRDIYDNYLKSIATTHVPVLKSKVNPNMEIELEKASKDKDSISSGSESEPNVEESETPIISGVTFRDVKERNPFTLTSSNTLNSNRKKVSKFKAARLKAT